MLLLHGTQKSLTYVTQHGLLMLWLVDCLPNLLLNLNLSLSNTSRAAQPLQGPATHTHTQVHRYKALSDESSCKQAEPQTKQSADWWWKLFTVMGNRVARP